MIPKFRTWYKNRTLPMLMVSLIAAVGLLFKRGDDYSYLLSCVEHPPKVTGDLYHFGHF